MWLFLGVVAMVATLAVVRSVDAFTRYKYTIGLAGLILLILPMILGVRLAALSCGCA